MGDSSHFLRLSENDGVAVICHSPPRIGVRDKLQRGIQRYIYWIPDQVGNDSCCFRKTSM
jgi:hypothetical protein